MNAALVDALWYLGRGTGAGALVLLTLSVCLGILTRSGRSLPGLPRFAVADLHRTASLTGVGLVALHLVTLLFDPYAQLRVVDLVVPFLGSSYRPLSLGLGTLAVDLLVLVALTSLLRRYVGPALFRAVHWSAYALWPLALLHGLGTGTDAESLWFTVLCALCAGAVCACLAWRVTPVFAERGRERTARRVGTR